MLVKNGVGRTDTDQETWTYGYDHRNQLTWAEQRATDGGTLLLRADFVYDVFGNRLETRLTAGGQTTVQRYALDGWKSNPGPFAGTENWDIWADLDGDSSLTTRYVRGDGLDEIVARVSSGGAASWYLTDRLGSVRDLIDAAGTVVNHLDYDGFGVITAQTNAAAGDRWAYTGREWSPDLGLYYYRARWYGPAIARWLSQDPLGFTAGDTNLYRYVGNNTTSAIDPSGRAWLNLADSQSALENFPKAMCVAGASVYETCQMAAQPQTYRNMAGNTQAAALNVNTFLTDAVQRAFQPQTYRNMVSNTASMEEHVMPFAGAGKEKVAHAIQQWDTHYNDPYYYKRVVYWGEMGQTGATVLTNPYAAWESAVAKIQEDPKKAIAHVGLDAIGGLLTGGLGEGPTLLSGVRTASGGAGQASSSLGRFEKMMRRVLSASPPQPRELSAVTQSGLRTLGTAAGVDDAMAQIASASPQGGSSLPFGRFAPASGNLPLRSPASPGSPGSVLVPRQNIPTGEVTMQELLADATRVPGSQGAYLRVQPGEAIRFSDLSQLTINHNGAEFMLSREVVRNDNQVTRRWRIYSGTPDQVPPPNFLELNAAGGGTRIERIVGHTHPRPIPYDPIFTQPSGADLYNLNNVAGPWRQVYGPQSEPFGRIIWGLNPGETTIYGIGSTPGNAVPPSWLRRP